MNGKLCLKILLPCVLLNACITENAEIKLKSEVIPYEKVPINFSDGFYYEVEVYTDRPYQGNPKEHIDFLIQDSITFSDVWAESGPCVSKGKQYGSGRAFVLKSDKDYGEYIHSKSEYTQPWLQKIKGKIQLNTFSNSDSSFCDSGRVITHYWYGN